MTRSELMKCYKLLENVGTGDDYYVIQVYDYGWYRLLNNVSPSISNLPNLSQFHFSTPKELKEVLIKNGLLKWVPEEGEKFWTVDFGYEVMLGRRIYHDYDELCKQLLKRGLIFRTQEEAIKKAKSMLDIVEGN